MSHRPFFVVFALLAGSCAIAETDLAAIEDAGAVIGDITLNRANVFNLDDPEENKSLYRLANRWHVITTDDTVRKQLLFEPGDPVSARLIDESERILRRNKYLWDADIKVSKVEDGKASLTVSTRDVWTLTPDISLSRSGGENRTKIGLEETNLLGRGQLVRVARIEDVDRDSNNFEFSDNHIGHSWISGYLRIADNSDGRSNVISAVRPFIQLDSRWSAGISLFDDERDTSLYRLGDEVAEFSREQRLASAFIGWSAGLQKNWVRRWTAGFVFDDKEFSAVENGTLTPVIPNDRKLVYPFVGLEIVQNRYEKSANRTQIGKTEDFFLGTRLNLQLGYSSESFGSSRDALVFQAAASKGFGSLSGQALLLEAGTTGRLESGDVANNLSTLSARYFHRQSDKKLFFVSLAAAHGENLALDNPVQLGGDTGLRGYPLRYQNGHSKMVITVEQRYFTDWYPFRLFRVGAAVFADAGRTWGDNPVGGTSNGWLRDVGFGLRFSPTRGGTTKLIHLDLAFPLDGDASIDDVQVLLEAKRSF